MANIKDDAPVGSWRINVIPFFSGSSENKYSVQPFGLYQWGTDKPNPIWSVAPSSPGPWTVSSIPAPTWTAKPV